MVVDDSLIEKKKFIRVFKKSTNERVEGKVKFYKLTKTLYFIQDKNYEYDTEYSVTLTVESSTHQWSFKTTKLPSKVFRVKTYSLGPIKDISLQSDEITIEKLIEKTINAFNMNQI